MRLLYVDNKLVGKITLNNWASRQTIIILFTLYYVIKAPIYENVTRKPCHRFLDLYSEWLILPFNFLNGIVGNTIWNNDGHFFCCLDFGYHYNTQSYAQTIHMNSYLCYIQLSSLMSLWLSNFWCRVYTFGTEECVSFISMRKYKNRNNVNYNLLITIDPVDKPLIHKSPAFKRCTCHLWL